MATIRFFIRAGKTEERDVSVWANVFISKSEKGRRIQFQVNTDIKVPIERWDEITGRVRVGGYTKEENDMINEFSELPTKFNAGKGKQNLFVDQIVAGYAVEGMSDAEESVSYVTGTMGGKQYLMLKEQAWKRLQTYYAELSK